MERRTLSNIFALTGAFLVASVAVVAYQLSAPDGVLFIVLIGKACIWVLLGAVMFPRRLGLICFFVGAIQVTALSVVEMLMSGISLPLVVLTTTALASAGAFTHLYNRANARLESLED